VTAPQTIAQIEAAKVIAILRGDFRHNILQIADALSTAGITAIEATLNSPGVLDLITALSKHLGNRIAIGAGTVLTPQDVHRVADAGATFIVSPNCNPAVISETKKLGLVSIPGCFTPTEVIAALDAGADAVKLFPATTLGPGYVKALRAPIPNARLVPTGGVTPELAGEYFRAGAWAIGVGSELISPDPTTITARAAAFVSAMRGES
jgi:Entner-Doudoroff aldolase